MDNKDPYKDYFANLNTPGNINTNQMLFNSQFQSNMMQNPLLNQSYHDNTINNNTNNTNTNNPKSKSSLDQGMNDLTPSNSKLPMQYMNNANPMMNYEAFQNMMRMYSTQMFPMAAAAGMNPMEMMQLSQIYMTNPMGFAMPNMQGLGMPNYHMNAMNNPKLIPHDTQPQSQQQPQQQPQQQQQKQLLQPSNARINDDIFNTSNLSNLYMMMGNQKNFYMGNQGNNTPMSMKMNMNPNQVYQMSQMDNNSKYYLDDNVSNSPILPSKSEMIHHGNPESKRTVNNEDSILGQESKRAQDSFDYRQKLTLSPKNNQQQQLDMNTKSTTNLIDEDQNTSSTRYSGTTKSKPETSNNINMTTTTTISKAQESKNDPPKKSISYDDIPIRPAKNLNSFYGDVDEPSRKAISQSMIGDEEPSNNNTNVPIERKHAFDDIPIGGKATKRFEDILEEQLKKNPYAAPSGGFGGLGGGGMGGVMSQNKQIKKANEPKKEFLKKGTRQYLSNAQQKKDKKDQNTGGDQKENIGLNQTHSSFIGGIGGSKSHDQSISRPGTMQSARSQATYKSDYYGDGDQTTNTIMNNKNNNGGAKKFLTKGGGKGGGKGNAPTVSTTTTTTIPNPTTNPNTTKQKLIKPNNKIDDDDNDNDNNDNSYNNNNDDDDSIKPSGTTNSLNINKGYQKKKLPETTYDRIMNDLLKNKKNDIIKTMTNEEEEEENENDNDDSDENDKDIDDGEGGQEKKYNYENYLKRAEGNTNLGKSTRNNTTHDQSKCLGGDKGDGDEYKFDDENEWNDDDKRKYNKETKDKNDNKDNKDKTQYKLNNTNDGKDGSSPPKSSIVRKYFYDEKPNKNNKKMGNKGDAEGGELASDKDDKVQKLLKERIELLNTEIAKVKLEGEMILKKKQKQDEILKGFEKEKSEWLKQKEKEMQEFEEWKQEEIKKIKREKKVAERTGKALQNMPNRKEREEIESLKKQLAKALEDSKIKDKKNQLYIDRLRKQVDELTQRNQELLQEVKYYEQLRIHGKLPNVAIGNKANDLKSNNSVVAAGIKGNNGRFVGGTSGISGTSGVGMTGVTSGKMKREEEEDEEEEDNNNDDDDENQKRELSDVEKEEEDEDNGDEQSERSDSNKHNENRIDEENEVSDDDNNEKSEPLERYEDIINLPGRPLNEKSKNKKEDISSSVLMKAMDHSKKAQPHHPHQQQQVSTQSQILKSNNEEFSNDKLNNKFSTLNDFSSRQSFINQGASTASGASAISSGLGGLTGGLGTGLSGLARGVGGNLLKNQQQPQQQQQQDILSIQKQSLEMGGYGNMNKGRMTVLKKPFLDTDYRYDGNQHYVNYLNIKDQLNKIINQNVASDGKVQRLYQNGKKEVIFHNGVKREIFPDGYTIVHFTNNDIKQTLPDGTIIYYFADAKTTQTTFPNGQHIYRFSNNQVEFHYTDNSKDIYFSDGTKKHITPNGEEETAFNDGTIQKINSNKIKTVEYSNGQKDTIYPDGIKIRTYPDGRTKKYYPDGHIDDI